MKIRSLFLSLPLLLSPALVQASDYVENGSSAIWSLRQLSDLSGDTLPQDLLNVLGKNLIDLEHHGILIPNEGGKKWVPVEKIVSDLAAFRDSESSEAEIAAVLEIKEQIKEGLLKKLSAQWEDGLEDLVAKRQKQKNGSWHASKAYGTAFLAYYVVEMSAAEAAAGAAAWAAAWDAAEASALNATLNAARYAAWDAAWYAVWDAALKAVRSSAEQKLKVLASTTADEIGSISYDIAELFTLLWLTENGHEYMKMAFDAAYAEFPEMELDEVKSVIEAAISKDELKDNIFIQALRRDLDALEKFVLAK